MGSPNIEELKLRHWLARNIKHYLRLLEWSENELAKRSGVSQKQVNNITNERTGCSIEAVEWIAREFGVPAWMLMVNGFEDLEVTDIPKLSKLVGQFVGAESKGKSRAEQNRKEFEKKRQA
jgi:transcriptional regulator with XRE-family HTH domain